MLLRGAWIPTTPGPAALTTQVVVLGQGLRWRGEEYPV